MNYREMTMNQIGEDASIVDFVDFVEACERVTGSTEHSGNADSATDFVWNGGEIRFYADACLYCGHTVANSREAVESEHVNGCRWFATWKPRA